MGQSHHCSQLGIHGSAPISAAEGVIVVLTVSPILALHLVTLAYILLHYTSKQNLLQSKAETDLQYTKQGIIFQKPPNWMQYHMVHCRG